MVPGVGNLIVNITNEWQTNLSLISRDWLEAGDPLGARLKPPLRRKKARKLKRRRAGRIGGSDLEKSHLLDVCSVKTGLHSGWGLLVA